MKCEKVWDRQVVGKILVIYIIVNFILVREWIVFFKKDGGCSYFLVDESDEVMLFCWFDDVVKELCGLGIKFVEIYFQEWCCVVVIGQFCVFVFFFW